MHFLEIHLNLRVRDIGCIGNEGVTGDVGDTGGLTRISPISSHDFRQLARVQRTFAIGECPIGAIREGLQGMQEQWRI
jgi:hypothetical protein